MKHTFLLHLLTFTLFLQETLGQTSCQGTLGDWNYDLTPLKSSTDYTFTIEDNNNPSTVRINMCQGVQIACTNKAGNNPAMLVDAVACENWPNSDPVWQATLGVYNQMTVDKLAVAGEGLSATFTGGSGPSNPSISVRFDFICDESAGTGNPTYSSKKPWIITWNTKVACRGNSSIGGGFPVVGGTFLILLFVGGFLYFIIGGVFNKFVRHRSGSEIIPNLEMWRGLGGLIKDGTKFIMLKTIRRGYQQV